jgi:hypothetical protein
MDVIKTDRQPATTISSFTESMKNDDSYKKQDDDSSASGGVSIGMDLFEVTGGSRQLCRGKTSS